MELKSKWNIFLLSLLFLLIVGLINFIASQNSMVEYILDYTVDTKTQDLKFYWKNDNGVNFGSIQNLKSYIEGKKKTLIFAMNGGMYMEDLRPLGLYIENGKIQKKINKEVGSGNFYIKPNGIFYITANRIPYLCKTEDFEDNGAIKYATQSGPMLVVDGKINSAFKENSNNLNIRNGVSILPNNKVIFAMSKTEINFYNFAKYFKSLGCKNALYLDGFVSRTYLPEKQWKQTDGSFGVIIGVTDSKIKKINEQIK
jgi:uncharacterized protein YigE (DUF2233 family)